MTHRAGSCLNPRSVPIWVVSSAVEHCLHTAGVTGSIPVLPTKLINDLRHAWCRFSFLVRKSVALGAEAGSQGQLRHSPGCRHSRKITDSEPSDRCRFPCRTTLWRTSSAVLVPSAAAFCPAMPVNTGDSHRRPAHGPALAKQPWTRFTRRRSTRTAMIFGACRGKHARMFPETIASSLSDDNRIHRLVSITRP